MSAPTIDPATALATHRHLCAHGEHRPGLTILLDGATTRESLRASGRMWVAPDVTEARWFAAEMPPAPGGDDRARHQPAPQPGSGDMWGQIIARYDGKIAESIVAIFRARNAQGLAQYQTPLQAHNGRDICQDIIDETLDRIAYAEQAATERPEFAEVMRGLQEGDIVQLAGLLALYGRAGGDQ